jgi:hypothetical protein
MKYTATTPLSTPEAILAYLDTLPKEVLSAILGNDTVQALVPEIGGYFGECGSTDTILVLDFLASLTEAVHIDDELAYLELIRKEANLLSEEKFETAEDFLDYVALNYSVKNPRG